MYNGSKVNIKYIQKGRINTINMLLILHNTTNTTLGAYYDILIYTLDTNSEDIECLLVHIHSAL